MDHHEELAVLRAERLKAIQNCEFGKARKIDNQLQHLKEQISGSVKEDLQRECQTAYEIEKEAVLLDAEMTYSESTAQIFKAKELYQKKMVILQKRHAEELEILAEQLAKDLELAMIREVPDSRVYRRQAQASALVQNYDNAEAMLQISQDVREDTMQERQLEIHHAYEIARQQLIEKHRNEDKTCEMMHLKNIENIRRKHKKSNDRLRKRLDFRAYSLRVPVNTQEIQINDLEIDDEDEIDVVKNKKSISAPVSALARRSSLQAKTMSTQTASRLMPKSPLEKRTRSSLGRANKQ